jgi:hypothetical protein
MWKNESMQNYDPRDTYHFNRSVNLVTTYDTRKSTMLKAMRFRFWLETIMATITGILFVITIVWRS